MSLTSDVAFGAYPGPQLDPCFNLIALVVLMVFSLGL
jgi:hypothetical protein